VIEVDEDRGGGGGWSEVGNRAQWGLLVGPRCIYMLARKECCNVSTKNTL
jgi:hypothetical protein